MQIIQEKNTDNLWKKYSVFCVVRVAVLRWCSFGLTYLPNEQGSVRIIAGEYASEKGPLKSIRLFMCWILI